jgi:hypothetical protein
MALEIDKNKIMNLSENLKEAVKTPTQTTNGGWMSITKEALEFVKGLPQGLAMVKGVLEDVKEIQRAPKAETATEPMKEGSIKKKAIMTPREKAKIVYDVLMEIAEKNKDKVGKKKGGEIIDILIEFIEEKKADVPNMTLSQMLAGVKLAYKGKIVDYIEEQVK